MEICPSCKSDIDPSAGGFAAPDLGIAAAVIRRVNPLIWPANGIPPTYKSYSTLYELLLIKTHGTGEDADKEFWSLPVSPTKYGVNPTVAIATAWPQLKGKRACFVDVIGAPEKASAHLLHCIPIDKQEESRDYSGIRGEWKNSSFFPLGLLLSGLRGLRPLAIDLAPDAVACIVGLDRWLAETHSDAESVLLLWRAPAYARIRRVEENRLHLARGAGRAMPAQRVVRNPLYHSGLVVQLSPDQNADFMLEEPAAKKDQSARASARPESGLREGMLWGDRHPVHRAACEGDIEQLRKLIREGSGPAGVDGDSWTPLHYAAWHGHEMIVRVLMEDWQGAPAARTDNGSTALHFAARNGWVDIVRILLACPIVSPSLADNDKHTPLWLCEHMQLNQWEEVSRILRNPQGIAAVNRFGSPSTALSVTETVEHRIFLMDGSEKVLRLPGGEQTTADMLRNAVAGILNVAEESWHVFSIWIVSATVEFQMEPDMKPVKRLKRWQEMVELYGNPESEETPLLFFKRNCHLTLSEERKTRSPVALKFLFDEAVHAMLHSLWPITVDQAVHLAGLLMQVRFGDANDEYYRSNFLADGLHTLVPQHLLHNQLKSSEWQRRILAAHREHKGKHDITLLHRLFLQYCWQWPFYGAAFYYGALSKVVKRALFSQKDEEVRLGINTEWLTIVGVESNTLKLVFSHDDYRYSVDDDNVTMTLEFSGVDRSKLELLGDFMKGQPDSFNILSRQAFLISQYLDSVLLARREAERLQQRLRMEQGGPQVLHHVSKAAPPAAATTVPAHARALEDRVAKEQVSRYHLLQSFGQSAVEDKCAAHVVFDRFAVDGGNVRIGDLKTLCYELGYFLGVEYEGARMILSASGNGQFSFRDLVAWWTQSSRNWLFLLDDEAFRKRARCVEAFLRCDVHRVGKLAHDQFTQLIRTLHSSDITQKSEEAVRKGLDPSGTDAVTFNDYVNWLTHMGLIDDQMP